ncbi:MAG: CHASE2 domain-containing protein [Bryobacteraceae bacterium]|nr:CHASE2 domain-containing protein [Bryobacteraceae bacterium]
MRGPKKETAGYVAALALCFAIAVAAGWTTFGVQIDNDAYDFMFRLRPPEAPAFQSAILAIDERTLRQMGGLRNIRAIVAEGLAAVNAARPRAVVVDVLLADDPDPRGDAPLEAVFAQTPNLVLASGLDAEGWEDPLPRFLRPGVAIGHVHAEPDPFDNVTRRIPLEKAAGRERRWALALEAYRVALGGSQITESPQGLELGGAFIPAPRGDSETRPLLIRYFHRAEGAASSIPQVSVAELREDAARAGAFRDKVVFVGVTAQSADDRHMTPYSAGQPMPGVEIHATAFETMAQGRFLRPVSDSTTLLVCLALAAAAGFIFAFQAGWRAYVLGAALLLAAHLAPLALFRWDLVLPYAAPVATAWLSLAGAATYQHFVVRRLLRKSESARTRYQQAIHFVTHEMRTPLTAIQGSSELMGRYKLTENKSRQLAQTINAESRRLARMIQTFLDVERLSQGEMELKREAFAAAKIVEACLERVRPLADRKRIEMQVDGITDSELLGDRELMEYAVYNLLNNAVKYSPPDTRITVSARRDGERLRLSVQDQGIGMDESELRSIFKKFYRTKRAEASGEAGTGIGLSIVDQIVTHHGGRIEVTSKPGAGSCFTVILPVTVSAAAPRAEVR